MKGSRDKRRRKTPLLMPVLMFFLFLCICIPAYAQEDGDSGENATATVIHTFQVRSMEENEETYELLINDNVVVRYRTMHMGFSARERAMIILERVKKLGSTLQNANIAAGQINGSPVIMAGENLLITVTEADYKANNSSGEGLAGVWLNNIRKTLEEREKEALQNANEESGGSGQGGQVGKLTEDIIRETEDTNSEPGGEVERETENETGREPEAEREEDETEYETENEPDKEPKGESENEPAEEVEQGQDGSMTDTTVSSEENEMLRLINQERVKAGIPELAMDTDLVGVARLKSQDMINNNYFAHTSPTYGDPFRMMSSFDIEYQYAGENLSGSPDVELAHNSLMNSPGHRKNILNSNYTHVGIGIVDGGPYGKMFTQLFVGR